MEEKAVEIILKVCVVGAGAAGLCAARHLAADSKHFEFVVFERQGEVGGTWTYNDRIGLDEDGLPVHSSMYRDLRTNLPKEIMGFPDYPDIKGGAGSCVSHRVILDYLKSYATHFQLRQYIQFQTVVESIKLKDPSSEKWQVRVRNVGNERTDTLVFDAVIICNGHYSDPRIPRIRGLGDFKGLTMHSHDYRYPEFFAGKRVVVLGAASSGIDIATELSRSASHVHLSHDNDRLAGKGESLGFEEVVGIDGFADDKFILKDGTSVAGVDALILCTGYNFTYPFLDASCGVKIDDNYVSPLYKHLVNVEHTSMCLVGLPMTVVPFPMFHMQVRYFISTLRDKSRLPAVGVMLEDSRLKASEKRHAHKLGNAQWAYNDSLARESGVEPLPGYYELGYAAWWNLRKAHLMDYKSFDLFVSADGARVGIVVPRRDEKKQSMTP
ncbi:flavin-containing monooxygenase FMO GS-OX-like 4 [Copidosoma floridanum]|uniref:flavin-containing monooxygenase FMO GS-OX-like 4 n=1 Tax=Copidosoma floridanum TaxID=29053 RepID=UPI0006C9418C|nr:flavin-containing monooxygenase FMO GS-OX-like 4 [Copidosoma floridanum]